MRFLGNFKTVIFLFLGSSQRHGDIPTEVEMFKLVSVVSATCSIAEFKLEMWTKMDEETMKVNGDWLTKAQWGFSSR